MLGLKLGQDKFETMGIKNTKAKDWDQELKLKKAGAKS